MTLVWCKLERQFFNLDQDIYVCSTYIPPADSVYVKNDSDCPFSESEKSIAKYSMLGEIILMGDFNARKGKLNDDVLTQIMNLTQVVNIHYLG